MNFEMKCPEGYFQCKQTSVCVASSVVCDSHDDCGDGTDEEHCETKCPDGDFQCKNGRCIIPQWKCDHHEDCGDGSDEENCGSEQCPENSFTCGISECLPNLWRCDGQKDCENGKDEEGCQNSTCRSDEFRCNHGQCLPSSWVCDGAQDCKDGSDESEEKCVVRRPANVTSFPVNPCDEIFCKNGGSCYMFEGDRRCRCLGNKHYGSHCEHEVTSNAIPTVTFNDTSNSTGAYIDSFNSTDALIDSFNSTDAHIDSFNSTDPHYSTTTCDFSCVSVVAACLSLTSIAVLVTIIMMYHQRRKKRSKRSATFITSFSNDQDTFSKRSGVALDIYNSSNVEQLIPEEMETRHPSGFDKTHGNKGTNLDSFSKSGNTCELPGNLDNSVVTNDRLACENLEIAMQEAPSNAENDYGDPIMRLLKIS